MALISTSAARISDHTGEAVAQRIRQETEERIALVAQGGPAAIERRLDELDREWDIERAMETGAAAVILAGLALGRRVDRRWYALPTAAAGFLLQHAIQGWCPPLPIMRRLGFRTADEINAERYALKALHGDFSLVSAGGDPALAVHAVSQTRH